ncbi:MAG: heavy metal translocating P-type ATPase, partial [Synergistaceae bacterium]|nr:heavy metal translocating P-type ATPase [Synergistaceae bacterium]
MKRRFRINNIDCPGCAAVIESKILELPGVRSASINMDGGVLTVEEDGEIGIDSIRRITASVEPDTKVEAFESQNQRSAHDHDHNSDEKSVKSEILSIILSAALFAFALAFGSRFSGYFGGRGESLLFAAAYIASARPVLLKASKTLFSRNFLNEFFLMSFASLAAIAIGKFPEAVSVMLFYRVGEFFQDLAASKSRKSI